MQRTLVSFIGTTDYSDTVYQWPGAGEYSTRYLAVALARLWGATRIVLLATPAAEDKHAGGLRQSLAEAGLPQPLFKKLPDGRTERELWTHFEVFRNTIAEASGHDMLIDVTHGFRAQPFFAGAVLSVLRAAGFQPQNLALVYGEHGKGEAASPVWDLTLFVELMDWAQALGLFLKTGVAAPVVELGREIRRREARRAQTSGGDYPQFGALVEAIERFGGDLETLRVASIITGYEQQHSIKSKVRGSAALLLAAIETCREEAATKLPPLALILKQLDEIVRPLVSSTLFGPEGQRAQHALAQRYLALGRYPEAAAVVREARVGQWVQDPTGVEVNSPDFDDGRRAEAEWRFATHDPDAGETADVRNDINHCGFRKQPQSAAVLRKRVEQLVERFAAGAGAIQRAPAGRTFFVTRHPGAIDWLRHQGIPVDFVLEHLDVSAVQAGDTVIGALPVHLAGEVCARRARYLHLALELPLEHRGKELTADDMAGVGARLIEYRVSTVS